jgi:Caspase domain
MPISASTQTGSSVAPNARSVPAGAKRVALVVGNSTYQTVPQLANPARDAKSMAQLFKDAHFDSVDEQLNLGGLDFKKAIRKFEIDADQADVAVIYYSGHGLEVEGTNYLIPVDARLASNRDVVDEAVSLERLMSSADGARFRLLILDACRENPFVATMRFVQTTRRGDTPGLGRIEPSMINTLIAYAAKHGSIANDGDGQHSPYTLSLLKNLTDSTKNRQEPFVYGSLGGGDFSLVPLPTVPQEFSSTHDIRTDYELAEKIGTSQAWQVFLGTHPNGFYSDLARVQLGRLAGEASKAPNAPPGGANAAPVSPNAVAPGR